MPAPTKREDFSAWFARCFDVPLGPALGPEEEEAKRRWNDGVRFDERRLTQAVCGLAEALHAADEYTLRRTGPELRAQAQVAYRLDVDVPLGPALSPEEAERRARTYEQARAAEAANPDLAPKRYQAGAVKYRQALEAEAGATRPLTPAECTERRTRFLLTLRKYNRWQLTDTAPPPGANLPPRALLALAWWAGFRLTWPKRNAVDDFKGLLKRHGLSWD